MCCDLVHSLYVFFSAYVQYWGESVHTMLEIVINLHLKICVFLTQFMTPYSVFRQCIWLKFMTPTRIVRE